jgi:hypothetical protein
LSALNRYESALDLGDRSFFGVYARDRATFIHTQKMDILAITEYFNKVRQIVYKTVHGQRHWSKVLNFKPELTALSHVLSSILETHS